MHFGLSHNPRPELYVGRADDKSLNFLGGETVDCGYHLLTVDRADLDQRKSFSLIDCSIRTHLAYDSEMNHRIVESNGIKMHLAEDGEGPLVVLCHGFPELWYSWRHQLKALAEAGYHVVAPDQRGYGKTDRPEAVELYDVLQLSGDIVGLVDALGETEAVIVGHDWGSAVAWFCTLLRPDIFRAVVLLSVPYLQRSWADIRPTELMKQIAGENQFYQLYFQEPGDDRRIQDRKSPFKVAVCLRMLVGHRTHYAFR
jgi:pimeloyl-ACP methyl ester carboxylesterase